MEAVSQVAGTFFSGVWTLLLKTDFPGIGVSLAGVMISLLLIRASIRIFQLLTGFGVNGSDYGRAADQTEKFKNAQQWKHRNKIGF